jgi:hypothetical protein
MLDLFEPRISPITRMRGGPLRALSVKSVKSVATLPGARRAGLSDPEPFVWYVWFVDQIFEHRRFTPIGTGP